MTNVKSNNNFFVTKDLSESGALLIKNQKLIRIERVGKTCWFYFENPDKCSKISNDFFFGNLTVNARDYYQTITKLKNRIFAGI